MLNRDELGTAFAYAVAGGVAALVDVSIFTILYHLIGVPIVSAMISFGLAAIVNYLLSSFFVFKSARSLKSFMIFFQFALVGLSINTFVTLQFLFLIDLSPVKAKICGIGVAFVFNYVMNRLFVFTRKDLGTPCP